MARFLCSHCGVDLRVVDRFTDYSTTRGPLTSYALVECDGCRDRSLRLVAAQPR